MGAKLSSAESDELAENHEINVTPFIDVMLVLLIIFMVAAPLSTVDVKVDLPASTAQPTPRPDKPVYFTVKSDLTLSLGNEDIARQALAGALAAATEGNKDARIFLRADKTVPYGDLMEVMNLLRQAGYLKIALVGLEAVPGAPGSATAPSLPGGAAAPAPAGPSATPGQPAPAAGPAPAAPTTRAAPSPATPAAPAAPAAPAPGPSTP